MIGYNHEESPLLIKSKAFAVRISKMVRYIKGKGASLINSQLDQTQRSGTSIMANVSESQFAQSRADFITKLHIALKEANETNNWIFLFHQMNFLSDKEYESISTDCNEIISILVSSLKTSKRNQQIIIK